MVLHNTTYSSAENGFYFVLHAYAVVGQVNGVLRLLLHIMTNIDSEFNIFLAWNLKYLEVQRLGLL